MWGEGKNLKTIKNKWNLGNERESMFKELWGSKKKKNIYIYIYIYI